MVHDGTFSSNVLVGIIEIVLVDDNPIVLDCGVGVARFTEEAESPITLTSSLTVSDLDADHVLTAAYIAITNAQDGDEISVNTSSLATPISIQLSNGTLIELAGRATAMEYQVRSHMGAGSRGGGGKGHRGQYKGFAPPPVAIVFLHPWKRYR